MSAYAGNWSFSSLTDYEACAYRFKLKKIDRLPEPPLPPDNPLERGTREHDLLYKYVMGEVNSLRGSTARGLEPFKDVIDHSRDLMAAGKAEAEEDWIFDDGWGVSDRSNAWLWAKLDYFAFSRDEGYAVVVDYKTGKSKYKAASHIDQMTLYAATAAVRHDWLERMDVELWYIDEGITRQMTFSREEALRYVGRFQQRADRIYNDKLFRANPNVETCRWCPYRPHAKGGTGACPVGV